MHTIDLLKGQGIPAKTTLSSITFVAITVVVPIFIAAFMFSFYLLNNIKIEMKLSDIAKNDEIISDLQPEVRKTKAMENERDLLVKRLTEVARCVDTFVQWSPILIALSEEMPSQLIMNKLVITSATGRVTGRRDDDKNKPAVIPNPKRTIALDIRGINPGSYNTTVQNYQDSLQSSAVFEPKFKAQPYRMASGTGDNPIETYFMNFESQTQ